MKNFSRSRIFMLWLIVAIAVVAVYLLFKRVADGGDVAVIIAVACGLIGLNFWDVHCDSIYTASLLVEEARGMVGCGKEQQVLECLDVALSYDPHNFEAILVKADLYRVNSKFDKSYQELQHANSIDPNSYKVYYSWGLTYYQDKKPHEAIKAFTRCVVLQPKFCESYFMLGQAFELAGEKQNALISYRKFQEIVTAADLSNSGVSEFVNRATLRIRQLS